ncbi:MAG: hypothetical protein IPL53_22075 [Ignavibacteria bacterium]|nr:hypothetical protein [Ignavibacteria bacterium]
MKESLLNTNGKTHQSKRNSNTVFFQPKLTINQPTTFASRKLMQWQTK